MIIDDNSKSRWELIDALDQLQNELSLEDDKYQVILLEPLSDEELEELIDKLKRL